MQTLALRTLLTKRKRRGRRREKRKKIRAISDSDLNLLNLPEEIAIEILSRLSLKSLVRFAAVSKQCRSLIQSGSVKIPTRINVIVSDYFSLYSINEGCHVKPIREHVKKIPSQCYIGMCGSCNGLLLIQIRDDLFLWNPLTKCSKKVLSYGPLLDDDYGVVSGLCFDSSNNDYKAVMALFHQTPSYNGEFVVVGSCRSKTWTRVHFPYHVSSVKLGPVVNENLHLFASKESREHFLAPHLIIYFNPQKNKFNKLPMPQPKDGGGDILLGLGVLEGCLCMVRCCDERPTNRVGSVEVLVMKKYGMKESWTTMFILSNLPPLRIYEDVAPLCFTKNGEILMKIGMKHIKAYNPNDNSQRDIMIPTEKHYFTAVVYEESLVTPIVDYNWDVQGLRGDERYVEISLSGPCRKERGYGESESEETETEEENRLWM